MRHSLLLLLHTACAAGSLSGTLSGPSLDDTALPSDGGGDNGGGDGTADGGDEGGDDTAPPTPRCEPEITLPTPWYTEGDAISLPITCTSGADLADYSLQLTRGPEGAAIDGAAVVWAADRGDAGTIELTVTATLRSGGDAEPATARFWVAEDSDHPSNTPADPLAYTEEWGLPVFHIQTGGGIGADYSAATITFDGTAYSAEIKKRGASSYSYPKNSYTLRFADDENELDAEAYGIPEKKDHLVLVSTFDDNSFVRQKLSYDTWAAIAETLGEERLVIRSFFAVVYLNGAYVGLYVAIDRPDDEFVGQMGLSRDGNLYKSVNHDANFKTTAASGGGKGSWHQGYLKKEGASLDDFSDLDALISKAATTPASDFMAVASDYIYTPDFMDWWLLVHVIDAGDSGGKNAWLYNDPTGPMQFRYCPWDMNHSFGQDWMTLRVGSSSNNDFTWTNNIFAHILNDPASREALFDRYQRLRAEGPYQPGWYTDTLDEYYALIEPSAQRDWDRWGDDYRGYWWASYRGDDWNDFEGEKAYLYNWLESRIDQLDVWYPPE